MIKEISMPMMAPVGGGSLSGPTWDIIPAAGPADIQSGRNVYIELTEDKTCTKASAGKILQFIKEGYIPVYKETVVNNAEEGSSVSWTPVRFVSESVEDGIKTYTLAMPPAPPMFAYSDALDKPFTTVARSSGSGSGSGQTNN